MIKSNSNVYLETSAVNFLADKYSWRDAKATRIYHSLKGTKFFISPVTLWEILLTSNEERREKLLYYLQHLCFSKLINSPSEFIINYILAGCPMVEKKYEFYSQLNISKVWEDLSENTLKTFIYDENELKEFSNMIRSVFTSFNKDLEDIILLKSEEESNSVVQDGIKTVLTHLKGVDINQVDSNTLQIYKLSTLLIIFILCFDTDFDNTTVKNFWKSKKIDSMLDRLFYIVKNCESLIYQGPFPIMAQMAMVQFSQRGKTSRGAFWDVLHSIYLIYVDTFYTNDEHFLLLRSSHSHAIFQRVSHLSEISWFAASYIEIDDDRIIKQ